ncbi:MAG: copper resistance system multicopper oxidase [Rhodospirillaceae bacterium]|jgi:CopA family copper-resistance protein|nr:copper resistance system multicopper oxidase [Rhodospirillaceae bacterium]MBT3782271.1 copper resistance system multicopper oxidase [Rhodospirillaceae bacterium]MBT3977408.1 copper resistance system multicopper oxidase [Rhodospirillaceae bacterium]MBT4167829.1 copper resistance system multicopper oxidase [Rhodospirillaceae bacterium]MBT4561714.1 copper resistance system multicopper oxidase [Rhodospirillaceae bacterium]
MRIAICAAFLAACIPATTIAGTYNLTVDKVTIDTGAFQKEGVGYNGASPGPVLRFTEGEDVTINVTNNLDVATSVHWHGLILPYQQDGVPTISYDGIKPGDTFTYQFPIRQSGTYWFHSHSGFQEPDGAYGAIVIKPKKREPFRYNREYVVQLTDSHPHAGARIMRNLKTMADYYNRQQQTLGDFFDDAAKKGFGATVDDRMAWGNMRMMPADIEDLQGFTPLINGKGPAQNWTGVFKPGERIRLRFINSSAMTYFDIRIPGLKMLVVNADGNNVQPVKVDEFRIAVAETYDVIVRPKTAKAFTIFAASMGRSAFGRGTLAPRQDVAGDTPALGTRPLLTMADMGMAHEGMDHGAMAGMDHGGMKKMDHSKMDEPKMDHSKMPKMDHSKMKGMDHSKMSGMKMAKPDPFYAPGSGLAPKAANGGKFLSYKDLKAQKPRYKHRQATREIELRLTGNMERYIWSINGKKYQDDEEIRLRYGERVRFKFVNETMMSHPMHLHGMWTILDTGAGKWNPIKHTISVAPGTTVYTETEVDAPGQWAFHCHLSYHAASGMFRRIVVEGGPKTADAGGHAISQSMAQ